MGELENAAERVMRTMRALDAHRHETAPTLEREHTKALEAYFVIAERSAGREPVEEATPDGDEEARAEGLRNDRTSIVGHYAAARRALRLARAYRMEPGSSGRRERDCIAVVLRHRDAIRALRLRMQPGAEQLVLPGLAKTRPAGEVRSLVRSA